MSIVLSRVLAQSVTMFPSTVALSPESVTVLLYAVQFLQVRRNWLDLEDDPVDEVTNADWDEIEKLVANLVEEVYTPMIGYCFPVVLGGIPDNCLPLDGGTYARDDYPVLYDLLDAAYIVDADSFILPDLRSRVPIGAGQGTGLSDYAVNQTGGEETHSLTSSENGTHTHAIGGAATGLALAPGELPVLIPSLLPGSTDASGLGSGHNNLQPYVALTWAVVAL